MSVTIKTNYTPRSFIYGCELTSKEREQFDYIPGWNPEAYDYDEDTEEFSGHCFIRYKDHLYDLSEFMRCNGEFGDYWQGYVANGFCSGVLIHLADDGEDCVMGTYFG